MFLDILYVLNSVLIYPNVFMIYGKYIISNPIFWSKSKLNMS